MLLDQVDRTPEREEEMQHPRTIWTDPAFADESLDRLRQEYMEELKSRSRPVSPATIEKYNKSLLSFLRYLSRVEKPQLLSSLTPHNVSGWVNDQRSRGLAEEGIASRLTALKVFSHKYLYKTLELTTADLLRKVAFISPPERRFPSISPEERDRLLSCYNRGTYEDIRDRALVSLYMATGLRFSEVLQAKLGNLDRVSGELRVMAKGNRERYVRLSQAAMKELRNYLRERPSGSASDNIFLTEDGRPLTFWGGQSIFRRLKKKSGLPWIHAHALRHNFAQYALRKGAERRLVQDMLGHRSDTMTRRYLGNAREETAARAVAHFSPL